MLKIKKFSLVAPQATPHGRVLPTTVIVLVCCRMVVAPKDDGGKAKVAAETRDEGAGCQGVMGYCRAAGACRG